MTLYDLLFIALFFAAVGTVAMAVSFALRGQGARALRILARLGVAVFVYMGIVAITSAFNPRRVLSFGEAECNDDWCIAVESSKRVPAQTPGNVQYVVNLTLSSRAKRVSQREKNVVVYLTDASGRRIDPVPDPSEVPLSVLLDPNDSVAATRSFEVPANAGRMGLVIDHEGGFPIGWFIIGYATWFRKPTMVWLI